MAENEPIQLIDCTVTYDAIRTAMVGEPYSMSLVGEDARAVVAAGNPVIDAHLEACNGDEETFEWGADRYVGARLNCKVSPKSLPTLVRRLAETGEDVAELLAETIVLVLGIDPETGVFVGREALGLE